MTLDPEGRVRILYLTDVGEFNVRYRTSCFLTLKKAEALKSIFLKPGDILIARCPSPLGRACVFDASKGECITTSDVFMFRNTLKNIDSLYLCYYLNSPLIRAQIKLLSRGSL